MSTPTRKVGDLSPDIEDRRNQTSQPLLGRIGSALQGFMYNAKLAGPEFWDATVGHAPTSLQNFYVPGQDASSMGGQIQTPSLKPTKLVR